MLKVSKYYDFIIPREKESGVQIVAVELICIFRLIVLGLTDGLKIDPWGYIWTSIPNGFAVIDATSNEVICQILLGINTSNLAFGNNGDVWLTGKGGIWKLQRKIPEKNNEEVNKNNNNIRQDL